ncbi:type II toxin-antitoxin system Phd/YefM family antitoxin [Nocardioides sp.]|uniref:type II toxin-antitoxin system Phd/YefM family antitoxin n=1 Tax=Nocardioides sp. TaxID=35761 RepID=UPI0039E304D6
MAVTATQLRADIFRLLDRVLETGEPLEIKRNGRILRVVSTPPESKLSRLVRREGVVNGDPDDLAELQVYDWDPDRALNP